MTTIAFDAITAQPGVIDVWIRGSPLVPGSQVNLSSMLSGIFVTITPG